MANNAKRKYKSSAKWTPSRGPLGPMPLIIVAVGAVAMLATWFAQNALFSGESRRAAADGDGLRISEVLVSNAVSLITDTGDAPDWIELENTSESPIDLTGYSLIRETRPADAFAFPSGIIQPGEHVVVYADGSGQSLVNGEYHAPFRLPASGETLALIDKRGEGVDLVEVPALSRDQSYCRDAAGIWQVSDYPTPGEANRAERAEGLVRDVRVIPGPVEISEVMCDNATFFPDENGKHPDYIEIHNTGSSPVNLSGWYLSDNSAKLMRWEFPAVVLPADGYLAVHCSGSDRRDDEAHLHASFRLSNKGEDVYLTNPNGVTVSHVRAPVQEADQAYSRIETGWSRYAAPSPGYPNNAYGADMAGESVRQDNTLGVYVTEVLASSSKSDDWIELYNASSEAVDLSNYGLSDNAGRPRKWQFPQGTVIQPGAYLGVFCNGLNTSTADRIQTSYRLASEGGYSVVLARPDGAIVDRLFVPMQYQDLSYGRVEGQSGLRYFTTVTPGTANYSDAYLGRAPQPVYSVPGGMYRTGDVLTVEMSVPSGCRIYYTLDCTDPNESSALYTEPITVSDTAILRTRVYGEGYLESYMDTQSYLYNVNNANGTVFVVSLVSDPYNLTSEEAGIMIKGPNALEEYPYGSMNKGANFWMDWEREAHVEVFNPDGSTMISQECGVKLHGQYSRAEKQKAFKVIARSQYGSNRFQASIFSKRPYTEYQSFLLRSSSEDGYKTRMRDAVMQSLAEDTSLMYQETEVGVLYIDGQYWGHYNLRERINTASICQFEGWEGEEDDLDLIKANTNVMQGSNETMEALLTWIKANKDKLNTEEFWNKLDNAIDIQNYIEYMAVEMYTGNTDTLNVKRYRNPNRDGKWRWVLFDLDWAFHEDTNSVRRWLTPGGMGNNKRTDNTLFIACMMNDRFRDRYLTHMGREMATTFTADAIVTKIENFYNVIAPLMPDHYARWDFSESQHASGLKAFVNYANSRPYRMLQFLKYCEYLPLSQAQMEQYFGDAMAVVGVTYDQIEEP